MKNTMKKIICSVLTVLMFVSVIPLWVSGLASDDYTQWKQGNSEWNKSAAWPANEYPGAIYNYMSDGGCVVTSLAMLLRHHNVITDSNVNSFNPWICNEDLKRVGAFDSNADLSWASVTKAYPGFELVDYRTPYS